MFRSLQALHSPAINRPPQHCHLLRRLLSSTTLFAPDPSDHALPPAQQQRLVDFMQHCSTHRLDVAILSGAGLSTASGIPDYRSTKGSYTKGHKPMQHQDFVKSTSKRKRFWARSLRGYKYFGSRSPNLAHKGLAALEKANAISGIVTQNVDRLHHLAGSSNVVELHGRGDRVVCLSCAHAKPRALFTKEMEDLNASWMQKHGLTSFTVDNDNNTDKDDVDDIRADGDAHLDLSTDFDDFVVPCCDKCKDGVMMPDLVFFGGSIRTDVKDAAAKIIDDADALIVIGSSCTVYSSYRLVRAAALADKPIVLINIGETRIDPFVSPNMKFETTTDEAIETMCRALGVDVLNVD